MRQQIDDRQYARSVENEHGDKPYLITCLGSAPQGETLPGKLPYRKRYEDKK